jgi:hypothetical protein
MNSPGPKLQVTHDVCVQYDPQNDEYIVTFDRDDHPAFFKRFYIKAWQLDKLVNDTREAE